VRSSHMYVGQEVQSVTIHRQTTAQPATPHDGQSHSAAPLRASIALSPCASPSRPLHAACDPHVGHQVPPRNVLSCSGCPTVADSSGRAAFSCIEQSQFTAMPRRSSEAMPLHAEWGVSCFRARWPATSPAARAAAPVIVAAARAGIVRQRPLSCAVGNAVQRFKRK
jgi:hypothetical protein